ncbi:hypothetical protein OUZ56_027491 [Daphnia magna]|uniref:Uncharacterized protein n=1 Tax=Daphnia magna TaxID=35525 RepID=A0ABQ9ZPX6_9CRUS|nr:hypothetical protein OUZ56_027491 [Daphnia magna]
MNARIKNFYTQCYHCSDYFSENKTKVIGEGTATGRQLEPFDCISWSAKTGPLPPTERIVGEALPTAVNCQDLRKTPSVLVDIEYR